MAENNSVDYALLRLQGLNNEEIAVGAVNNPDSPITMQYEPEQAWEQYGKKVLQLEDDQKATFLEQYGGIQSDYNDYMTGAYNANATDSRIVTTPDISKKLFGADITGSPVASAKYDPRFAYGLSGPNSVTKVLTESQFSDQKGYYLERGTGVKKPLDEFLKRHELGGKDYWFPDTFLAMEYDENNEPHWVEMGATDDLGAREMRSSYGPQQMKNSVLYDTFQGFANMTWRSIPTTVGALLEVTDDLYDFVFHGEDKRGFGDKWGNYLQNVGSNMEAKPSYRAANAGAFDNLNSFGYAFGGAIGTIADAVTLKTGLTKQISSAMSKRFLKQSTKYTDDMVKKFGKKNYDELTDAQKADISMGELDIFRKYKTKTDKYLKVAGYANMGALSLLSGAHFKKAAEQQGFTEAEQALVFFPAAAATYLSEMVFANNIFTHDASAAALISGMRKITADITQEAVDTFGKPVTDEGKRQMGKFIFSRFNKVMKETAEAATGAARDVRKGKMPLGVFTLPSKLPNVVKGGFEEGPEEGVEQLFQSGVSAFMDWANSTKNAFSERTGGYRYSDYHYTTREDEDGKIHYIKKRKVDGEEQPVTQKTWNFERKRQSKEGDGQFNKYDHRTGFFGNWSTHMFNDIPEAVGLGAIAGSFSAGFQKGAFNINDPHNGMRAEFVADAIYKGKGNELKQYVMDLSEREKGAFGMTHLDDKGNVITEEALAEARRKGETIRTMDEAIRDNLIQEIDVMDQIYKSPAMQSVRESAEALDSAGITHGGNFIKRGMELKKRALDIESELEGIEEGAEGREALQKELESINRTFDEMATGEEGERVYNNAHLAEFSERAYKDSEFHPVDELGNNKRFTAGDLNVHTRNYVNSKEQEEARIEQERAEAEQREVDHGDLVESLKSFDAKNIGDDFFTNLRKFQDDILRGRMSDENINSVADRLGEIREDILKEVDSILPQDEAELGAILSEFGTSLDEINETGMDVSEILLDLRENIKPETEEGKAIADQLAPLLGYAAEVNSDHDLYESKRPLAKEEEVTEEGEEVKTEQDATDAEEEKTSSQTAREYLNELEAQDKELTPEQKFINDYYSRVYAESGDTYMDMVSELRRIGLKSELQPEDEQTLQSIFEGIKTNVYYHDFNNGVMKPLSTIENAPPAKFYDQSPMHFDQGTSDRIKKRLISLLGFTKSMMDYHGVQEKTQKNRVIRNHFNKVQLEKRVLFEIKDGMGFNEDQFATIADRVAKFDKAVGDHLENQERDGFNMALIADAEKNLNDIKEIFHAKMNEEGFSTKKLVDYMKENADYAVGGNTFMDTDIFGGSKNTDYYLNNQGEFFKRGSVERTFQTYYVGSMLQGIKRLSPTKFAEEFRKFSQEELDTKTPKHPSLEQERNAIYSTLAFMYGQDESQFIAEYYKEIKGSDVIPQEEIKNTISVLGYAGAGKSTVVLKPVLQMYKALTGRTPKVMFSAPGISAAKNIADSLKNETSNVDSGHDYRDVLEGLKELNKGSKDPLGMADLDVLVIDEASLLSTESIDSIRKNLLKANPNAKLMLVGDNSQMTDISVDSSGQATMPFLKYETTEPIREVFRSGAADIVNLANEVRKTIGLKGISLDINWIDGVYSYDRYSGLEYVPTADDAIRRFKDDLLSEDPFIRDNTILVVATNEDRIAALNKIKEEAVNSKVKNLDDKVKTLDTNQPKEQNFSIQGDESPRVIVALDQREVGKNMENDDLYKRAVLTAVSRASTSSDGDGYVMISAPGFSREGTPVVVKPKELSPEEKNDINIRHTALTGKGVDVNRVQKDKKDSDAKADSGGSAQEDSTQTDLDQDKIKAVEKTIRDQNIEFIESTHKYDFMDNSGNVVNTVDGMTTNIKNKLKGASKDLEDMVPWAKRGLLGHKMMEIVAKNYNKTKDTDLDRIEISEQDELALRDKLNEYNTQAAKDTNFLEEMSINLEKEGDHWVMNKADNKNIVYAMSSIMKNVIKETGPDVHIVPELLIGSHLAFSENDGSGGQVDLVVIKGFNGDKPIVATFDLKILTPTSYDQYEDTKRVSGKGKEYVYGELKTDDGEIALTKRDIDTLQQLAYAKTMEMGDAALGTQVFEVESSSIIMLPVYNDFGLHEKGIKIFNIQDSNVKYKKLSKWIDQQFIADGGTIVNKAEKIYDEDSEYLGREYENKVNNEDFVVVQGFFTQNGIDYVELSNGRTISVGDLEKQYSHFEYKNAEASHSEDVMETDGTRYGAVRHNEGKSYSSSYFMFNDTNEKFPESLVELVRMRLLYQASSNKTSSDVRLTIEDGVMMRQADGSYAEMDNVVSVSYDAIPTSMYGVIAEELGVPESVVNLKFLKDNRLNVISVLGEPINVNGDIEYNAENLGYDINSLNDIYNRDLIKIRNLTRASEDGITVKFNGVVASRPKYKSEFASTPYSKLEDKLKEKGFYVDDFPTMLPHGDFSYYDRKTGEKKYGSGIIVNYWKIDRAIDGERIVLRGKKFFGTGKKVTTKELDKVLQAINDLESDKASMSDLATSFPFKGIVFNRSNILDKGVIKKELKSLAKYLKIDKAGNDLTIAGKTPGAVAGNLKGFYTELAKLANDGNVSAKNFQAFAGITRANDGFLIDRPGKKNLATAIDLDTITNPTVYVNIRRAISDHVASTNTTSPNTEQQDSTPANPLEDGDEVVFLEEDEVNATDNENAVDASNEDVANDIAADKSKKEFRKGEINDDSNENNYIPFKIGKYENYTRVYKDHFGIDSSRVAERALFTLDHYLIGNSPYNRNILAPIKPTYKMIQDAHNQIIAEWKGRYGENTKVEGIEGVTDFRNKNEVIKNMHKIISNGKVLNRYIYYVLANNSDVFYTMVKNKFSNLDVEAIAENIEAIAALDDSDITSNSIGGLLQSKKEENPEMYADSADALLGFARSSLMDDASEEVISESMSNMFKWVIGSNNTYERIYDQNDNFIKSERKRITGQVQHGLVFEKIQTAYSIAKSGAVNNDQKRMNLHERVGDNLRKLAEESGKVERDGMMVGTDMHNQLMAIYETFYYNDYTEAEIASNSTFSYYALSQRYQEIAAAQSLSEEQLENLREKSIDAANLMSVVNAHLGSTAIKRPQKAKVTRNADGDLEHRAISYAARHSSEIKANVQRLMMANMYTLHEGGWVVKDSYKEMFKREGKDIDSDTIFSVEADTVYSHMMGVEPVPIVSWNKNAQRFEFSDQFPKDKISELNYGVLKRLYSFGGAIKNNTWFYLMSFPEGENIVADLIGYGAVSGNMIANPASEKRLSKIMEKGYKRYKGTVDVDSFDNMLMSEHAVEEKVNDKNSEAKVMKPSDMIDLVTALSEAETLMRNTAYLRSDISVNGKSIARNALTSDIWEIFGDEDSGDNNASDRIARVSQMEARELLEEGVLSQSMNGIMGVEENGHVRFWNDILDTESDHHYNIKSVTYVDGIYNDFQDSRYGENMTSRDYSETVINTHFIAELLKSRKMQIVRVPHHNMAEAKRLPMYELRFSDNTKKFISISVDEKSGKASIKINKRIRDHFVTKRMRYHRNAQKNSINKWKNLLASEDIAIINENTDPEVIRRMDDGDVKGITSLLRSGARDALADIVEAKRQKQIAIYQAIVADNNFLENRDYVIVKQSTPERGYFETGIPGIKWSFGNNTVMKIGSSINASNYRALEAIPEKNTKQKSDLIDSMFESELDDFISELQYNVGYELPDSIKEAWMTKDVKDKDGNLIRNYNPALEAFFWTFKINDFNVSQIVHGDTTQYKDASDLFKRSKTAASPGHNIDVDNIHGIGPQQTAIEVRDITGIFNETDNIFGESPNQMLQTIRGLMDSNQGVNSSDGLAMMTFISQELIKRSVGGNIGIIGKGSIKATYTKSSTLTNEAKQYKYAIGINTPEMIENSSAAEKLFRMQVGDSLADLWFEKYARRVEVDKNGVETVVPPKTKEFINYIIESGRRGEVIDQVVFHSAIKTGVAGLNDINEIPTDDLTRDEWLAQNNRPIDNKRFRIQLNPEKNIEELRALGPNQVLAEMGATDINTEAVSNINKLKAKLGANKLHGIEQKINRMPGDSFRKKAKAYLRELAKVRAINSGSVGKLNELLENPNISIESFHVRAKVIQHFNNEIKDKTIKFEWSGINATQMPSMFLQMIEDEEGNIYFDKKLPEGVKGRKRKLNGIRYFADPDFTQEITMKNPGVQLVGEDQIESPLPRQEGVLYFDDFVANKQKVYVKPMELVMGSSRAKEFGIQDAIEKGISLSQIFSVLQEDGKSINLRNLDAEQTTDALKMIYDENPEGQGYIRDRFGSYKEASNFINNLRESLKIFGVRVPSSATSSGFIGEVVEFINDNSNTIFIPSGKNLVDGSDYDIDQLYLYTKSFDENGMLYTDYGKSRGISNRIFDEIWGYYQNSDNAEMYSSPIDMSSFRSLSQGKINDMRRKRKFSDPNDAGSNIFYYDKIMEGNNLIGIFANAIKNYSFLVHASNVSTDGPVHKMGFSKDGKSVDQPGWNNKYVIDTLAATLNLATDNAKELVLGLINVTTDSGGILAVMAMEGMSPEEIIKFFDDFIVKRVFNEVKKSRSITESETLNPLKVLNKYLDDPSILEKMNKSYIASRDRAIDKLNAKVNNDPENEELKEYVDKTIKKINQEKYEAEGWKVEKNIKTLKKLKSFAIKAEAVRRLSALTKLDGSNPIPVFDYELDKMNKNIELALGMTIKEYLGGVKKTKKEKEDFVKRNYARYMNRVGLEDADKLAENPNYRLDYEIFMETDRLVRDTIDIEKTIDNLPHIKQQLRSFQYSKHVLESSFFRNSEFVKDQKNVLMHNILKRQDLSFKKEYYEYYNQMSDYISALYFNIMMSDEQFDAPDIMRLDPKETKGAAKVKLSVATKDDRALFGQMFPYIVKEKMDKAERKDPHERTKEEQDIVDNIFLQNLKITPYGGRTVIALEEGARMGNEAFLMRLEASFKTLPIEMQKMFFVNELATKGQRFKKGDINSVISPRWYEGLSDFMEEISDEAHKYEQNKGMPEGAGDSYKKYNVRNKSGETREVDITNMFDIFNYTVGAHSARKLLLRRVNINEKHFIKTGVRDGGDGTWDNIPMQHKGFDEQGGYDVIRMIEESPLIEKPVKKDVAGSSVFNAYDVYSIGDDITSSKILKYIDPEKLARLQTGQVVRVNFKSYVDFRGQVSLATGQMLRMSPVRTEAGNRVYDVQITDHKKLTLLETAQMIKSGKIKSGGSKKKILAHIAARSNNEINRAIANAIQNSNYKQNMSDKVRFVNDIPGAGVNPETGKQQIRRGYFEIKTGEIVISLKGVESDSDIERIFLHEMGHDMGENVFHKKVIVKELNDAQKLFRADMIRVYNHFKKEKGSDQFKRANVDINEFWAEINSNSALQAFLANRAYPEKKKRERVFSIWSKIVDSVATYAKLGRSDKLPYSYWDRIMAIKGEYNSSEDYDPSFSEELKARIAKSNKASAPRSDNDEIVFLEEDYDGEHEPINNSSDVVDHLMAGVADRKSNSGKSTERLAANIYENMIKYSKVHPLNKTYTRRYYDKTFTYDSRRSREAIIAEMLSKDNIVDQHVEFEKNYKSSFIDWLNNGALESNAHEYFGYGKKGDKYKSNKSRYSDEVLKDIKRKVRFDPDSEYMRYSELKNRTDIGNNVKYSEVFEGMDPIIAIHPDGKSISIIDPTSLSLKDGNKTKGLFTKYHSNKISSKMKGNELSMREGDIRLFMLGMTAMQLKHDNPNLKIRNVDVLGIHNQVIEHDYLEVFPFFVRHAELVLNEPELFDKLPEDMKAVLTDDELYRDTYEQSYVDIVEQTEKRVKDSLEPGDYQIQYVDEIKSKIDEYRDDPSMEKELLAKIHARKRWLRKQSEDYKDLSNLTGEEYHDLSKLEIQLRKQLSERIYKGPNADLVDINIVERHGVNTHNIKNPYFQEGLRSLKRSINKIVEEFKNDFAYDFDNQLKELDQFYYKMNGRLDVREKAVDMGGERFKRLVVKEEVYDEATKQMVPVWLGKIHWDANDPETKKANLSDEELKIGKFMMDTLEEQMIKNLLHDNRHYKGYNEKKAKEDLAKRWTKGYMPIISENVMKMIFKGNIKDAGKKMLEVISQEDNIFDEKSSKESKNRKMNSLGSEMSWKLYGQFSPSDPKYGNEYRMEMLGVTAMAGGDLVLTNPKAQENLSYNMETVMKMFMLGSKRKIVHETETIPFLESIDFVMSSLEQTKGVDMKNTRELLTEIAERIIYFRTKRLHTKAGRLFDVDVALNSLVALNAWTGIAFNLPVGITAGMQNSLQMFGNSIANKMSNNRHFGPAEITKATGLVFTKKGRAFLEAITEMYQLTDEGEHSIVNDPRKKMLQKELVTSRNAFYLNWMFDYYSRAIIAAAQMMKDGSYAAHTVGENGRIQYDVTKDQRFWANGKLTKHGEILVPHLKGRLKRQGSPQELDKDLIRGYDFDEAEGWKNFADKYITGSYDPTTDPGLMNSTIGRAMMQYKRWLPDKVWNAFGLEVETIVGGKYEADVESGEVKYIPNLHEGTLTSVVKGAKLLAKHRWNSRKEWKNMPSHTRRNLVKASYDVTMFAILYALFNGLTGDWDEDDEAMLKDHRLVRILKYSALDMVIASPHSLAQMMKEPFPIVNSSIKFMNMFVGDLSKADQLLPGSSTAKVISETFDDLTDEE